MLLFNLFIVLFLTFLSLIQSRQVNIEIKSFWIQYSYNIIGEISEFISEYSSESLWNYIDDLCVHSSNFNMSDSKAIETIAYSIASKRII